MTIITVAIATTLCTTATDKDYTALCVTRKDVIYKNIPKRSKKSVRLSLKINSKTISKSK